MKRVFYIFFAISLFHNFTTAQQGWFVQYALPNSSLQRIQMLDSLNGWTLEGDSVFNTTNGGQSWEWNNVGYGGYEDVYFINNSTGWIAAGLYILKTTNAGQSWILQNSGPTQHRIIFVDDNTGFTFANTQLCRRTTNGGVNWITTSIGAGSIAIFSAKFTNHDTGWVGGANGNIYKTTNCGINWIQFNTGVATRLYDICFPSPDSGWAGGFDNSGESKIIFTSNGGINWVTNYTDPQSQGVESIFFVNPKTGWAAGLPGKIMRTTNAGLNWELQQSNAGNIHLNSMYFVSPHVGWIVGESGNANSKILKTTTGGIVPITPTYHDIPLTYCLEQNYPNPFNPVTSISFDVLTKSVTSLCVYDFLGRQIAVLVNKELIPGSYSVDFNASQLPSGSYFYRLRSGSFTESKKMVLIK